MKERLDGISKSNGSRDLLPGGTPHFHWTKSGTYVTQVSAVGPLGLVHR